MVTLQVDPTIKAKLNGLMEQMTLLDEHGAALGVFLPVEDYKKQILAQLEIPFSDEEIANLRKEQGGCSLQDFWKKMEATQGKQP